MNLSMKYLSPFHAVLLVLLLAASAVSCNKHDKDEDSTFVYTQSTSSALVMNFALKADTKVMENLDSVYFTIDPERGVIYNADSLPVGTDVSALKVSVTFATTVGQASFRVLDANNGHTDYEYTSTSSDAIDFRYGVTLTVTSTDRLRVKDYIVKVNVHKTEPDSIVWPMSARRDLPGATDDNHAVGAAFYNGNYWCLLHNTNGYLMSHATTPAGPWTTEPCSDFTADVRTLTATSIGLYVLNGNGHLCHSADGKLWEVTEVTWKNIIGAYQDRVLGLRTDETGAYLLDEYPRRDGYTPQPVAAGFPVKGFSQMLSVEGAWMVAPQTVMVGGVTAEGKTVDATWSYDGTRWATINSTKSQLPALDSPTLVNYYTYNTNSSTLKATRRSTWMVMGGKLADGSLNTSTYVSYNQGITWTLAGKALSIGNAVAPFTGALAMVHNTTLKQGAVQWECPYIYLIGGYDRNGALQNNIWQGVLTRMTYKPIK